MNVKDGVSKQQIKFLKLYATYGIDKPHVNLGCAELTEKNDHSEWSSPNLSR